MATTPAPELDIYEDTEPVEKTWSDKIYDLMQSAVTELRANGVFVAKAVGDNASPVQVALKRLATKNPGVLEGRCSVHTVCLVPKMYADWDPIRTACDWVQSPKMLELFPTPQFTEVKWNSLLYRIQHILKKHTPSTNVEAQHMEKCREAELLLIPFAACTAYFVGACCLCVCGCVY